MPRSFNPTVASVPLRNRTPGRMRLCPTGQRGPGPLSETSLRPWRSKRSPRRRLYGVSAGGRGWSKWDKGSSATIPTTTPGLGKVHGRYVVVGFRTRVPPGAQILLDEFSDSYNVAVKVEVDDGYSTLDLERAMTRVHLALYCDQYMEDAFTDSDEGVIRSRVLPSVDSPRSIADFERQAQEVLRYGPHEGLSVVVEEWPRGETSPDPAKRERLCDEYVESQSSEELAEWDTRLYAMQEGVEYEDILYLSGWHDDLSGVVGRISLIYPQADVRVMRFGRGGSPELGSSPMSPPMQRPRCWTSASPTGSRSR